MTAIQTSIHGRKVGLGTERTTGAAKGQSPLVATGGFIAGERGNQVAFSSPSTVALFDDFLGDVLADEWNPVETDTDGGQ